MSTPLASSSWTWIADVVSAVAVVLAFVSAGWHYVKASRNSDARGGNPAASATTLLLWLVALTLFASVYQRGIEVNHFPCQTMSEVLTVFSLALTISMLALHYALGLRRRSAAWAILDDALIAFVLAISVGTRVYIWSLSTAQRDLPPALQSYWFPPHISALIFSYATLSIAGLICIVYFSVRFWSGVFRGGQPRARQWTTLGLMTLVPFVQVLTAPVLALVGVIFWFLNRRGRVPEAATIAKLERSLDDVSFRAFSVGIPFLTAGLFMGAFWAQEAWANYWGWDSKENSALITWLVYVVYIHLRMLGGYRGEKAMAMLVAGTLSIFVTFQLFGYLPDSQKSMHKYTDDNVVPREGMQGPAAKTEASGAPNTPSDASEARGG